MTTIQFPKSGTANPAALREAIQSHIKYSLVEKPENLSNSGMFQAVAMAIRDEIADKIFSFAPYTTLFNATGQPAMSVPLHWDEEGLPIGMHFVGRYGDEATLFRLAGQLERARPWFDRIPPISR